MVTSENGEAEEPTTITARDLYNQARQQAAEQAEYDVQAGLNRLSAWMREDSTAGRNLRAVKTEMAGQTRGEPTRIALLHGSDSLAEDIGYRGPTACAAAGITYRQLDYWARTGLVEPSVRAAHGTSSQRLYSFRDIVVLKVVKRLLNTGISLQQIRVAMQRLRDRGTEDLAQMTLMSDGKSIYECTSPDDVVDLLADKQDGQGTLFDIPLGLVWQEVAGELAEIPGVRFQNGLIAARSDDELRSVKRRGSTG